MDELDAGGTFLLSYFFTRAGFSRMSFAETGLLLQNRFSAIKAERFVRATIVQFFPFIGIDVIHHPGDFFLAQMIKTAPFGKYSSYQSMIDFNRSFLVRASGIAIINSRAEIIVAFGAVLNRPGGWKIHCHCLSK